jgi:hypothetical protein
MTDTDPQPTRPAPGQHVMVALLWLAVGLPAAWGVYRTAVNAAPLFRGTATQATAPAAKP